MKKLALGIGGFFHDFNAAIINLDSGEVVAAEEERFSRIKHHPVLGAETTSTGCIEYCLQHMGASPGDVRHLILSDIQQHPVEKQLIAMFPDAEVHHVHHHLCHAAAAYYCSGAAHAAVLTLDGWGDNCSGLLLEGRDNKLEILAEISQEHSIAMEYLRATHWIGLGTFGAEGKTQGLAPYGRPEMFQLYMDEIELLNNGTYRLSSRLRTMDGYLSGEHYMGQRHLYNDFLNDLFPRRFPDEPLEEPHINLAASIQRVLETIAQHCATYLHETTGANTLVVGGGAGLNSSMNAALEDSHLFDHVYAHPSASDRGNGLGAVLYFLNNELGIDIRFNAPPIYMGRDFSDTEIHSVLAATSGIRFEKVSDPARTAAELLAQDAIVGWMQGRSELGARALGNRSILAHPGKNANKDRLNAQVKHREWFRPFAPSVLAEQAESYFDTGGKDFPYMTKTVAVKKTMTSTIPAVTHVDGTARLQTVTAENNPLYYRLISEFHQLSGLPVVVNTSFNDSGEPIVETPQDAIHCLLNTGIDHLVIGSFLVSKDASQ